jgi:hypothetical protein
MIALLWLTTVHAQSADGILSAARKDLRVSSGPELTISGGIVAVTQSRHAVDTESDAASDDLDTINGGVAGQVYFLTADNDGRTVVVKHAIGNIECPGAADIALAEDDDFVIALYTGGKFVVLWQRLLAGNVGDAGGGCVAEHWYCDADGDFYTQDLGVTDAYCPGTPDDAICVVYNPCCQVDNVGAGIDCNDDNDQITTC